MGKTKTEIRLDLPPEKVRRFSFNNQQYEVSANDLAALGVSMDSGAMSGVQRCFGVNTMDAAPALQTTVSITNPVQFFQYWAPEAVEIVTAARKIDDIAGRTIAGSFEDEVIVTSVLERTGSAQPYTDSANIPLASWNVNFETRSIVRFEEGLETGYLENARTARMKIDTHREKAAAAAESLAIEHNNIGFYGYADGTNKTYGYLNDPALPAYVTVAEGESGDTLWSGKTFNEITSDIITAVAELVNQLAGHFDPTSDDFTMAVSLSCTQWLNTMNDLGTKSVSQWLAETYPKLKVKAAVELNEANGGSNVFYLHVNKVNGKDTLKQYVPEVLKLIGVERYAKAVKEDYASATAGIIFQYPIGVVRCSGI